MMMMFSAGDSVVVWRECGVGCAFLPEYAGTWEAREVVGGICLGMKNVRDRLFLNGYMLVLGRDGWL